MPTPSTCLTTLTAALAICCAGINTASAAEPETTQRSSGAGTSISGSASVSLSTLGLTLGVLEANGSGDWSARVLLHSGSTRADRLKDVEFEGNRYDERYRFGPGVSLLADYRPWRTSGWRLTSGLVISRPKSTLTGRPDGSGNYSLNDHTYSVAQVGTLTAHIRHKPVSLYAGGGWESKPAGASGWRFVSDFGLLVTGKPTVTLTASNASGNTALQRDLDAEQRQLSKPHAYPVCSLGAAYTF